MFARVTTVAFEGIEARPIDVSISISRSAWKNGTGSGANATCTVNHEGRRLTSVPARPPEGY